MTKKNSRIMPKFPKGGRGLEGGPGAGVGGWEKFSKTPLHFAGFLRLKLLSSKILDSSKKAKFINFTFTFADANLFLL